jgi:hypothetical protein
MCLKVGVVSFGRNARAFGQAGLDIYAGDPKTDPTLVKIAKIGIGGYYVVFKVCGLKFQQAASLAVSGFDSFADDVPAKVYYFAQSKVAKYSNLSKKLKRNSGTDADQHDRFELEQLCGHSGPGFRI